MNNACTYSDLSRQLAAFNAAAAAVSGDRTGEGRLLPPVLRTLQLLLTAPNVQVQERLEGSPDVVERVVEIVIQAEEEDAAAATVSAVADEDEDVEEALKRLVNDAEAAVEAALEKEAVEEEERDSRRERGALGRDEVGGGQRDPTKLMAEGSRGVKGRKEGKFERMSRSRRCHVLRNLGIMWLAPFCHRRPT